MTDSRIQDFDRSIEQGSDEQFTHICKLCDIVHQHERAKHFCGHCDRLYCEDCLQKELHKHVGHKIVQVSDWGQSKDYRCPSCGRAGSKISRYCEDHDEYCCYPCARGKHWECDNVPEIKQLAKGVYTSEEFGSVNRDIDKKTTVTEQLTSKMKKEKQALQASKRKSIERLRDLRHEVNLILDKLEEDAFDEIDANYDGDDYELDIDIEESEDAVADLRCLRMYMESKLATEPEMFLKLKSIRIKVMQFDRQLQERELFAPQFGQYEFIADPNVLGVIENIKTLKLQKQVYEPMSIDQQSEDPTGPKRKMTAEAPITNFDQDKRRVTSPLMIADCSIGTKHERYSNEIASGLQRRSAVLVRPDKSQLQAEPIIQQKTISGEKSAGSQSTTNTAFQNYSHKKTSKYKLETTLYLKDLSDLGMEVNVDTNVSYRQIESQNVAKIELNEELDSVISLPAPEASHPCVYNTEQEDDIQECVKPKTHVRIISPSAFSKSESIIPGKSLDLSESPNSHNSINYMSLPQRINIRLPDDKFTCNIQGMCGLQNGSIILSDTKNKKLKLIDQHYEIITSCEVTAGPRAVSEVSEYSSVVAMNNKTIQFVSIIDGKTIKPFKYINLDHDCYGISHCNGKLYVTELNGTCVYVYDISGNILQTISKANLAGSSRFGRTQNVYITRDGSRIYVTDLMKGLVIVSPTGGTLATITQPGILSACGVCTDKSRNVYVSGLLSHNVVQFGDRGAGMQRVVATGVSYPTSIWFNSHKSEILVSNNPHPFGDDFLSVYKVKQ